MSDPLPLPETGGIFYRDPETGALIPATDLPPEPAPEDPIAPEAETPAAPVKKERRNA